MKRNTMRNEKGIALVIALLLMVLVTFIGVTAIGMTVYKTSATGDEYVSGEAGPVSRHFECK